MMSHYLHRYGRDSSVACGKAAFRCNWTTGLTDVTCEACKFAAEVGRLTAINAGLLEALEQIRKFSSAIERGEEPWREGVQDITRMALAAIAKAVQS